MLLNILYLHRTKGLGVEEVHIKGIISSFLSMGHEVRIVSPATNSQSVLPEKKGFKQRLFGYLSNHAPAFIFEIAELVYNIVAWQGCKTLQKKISVDLIYERYAINAIAGILFANKYRVPHILEVNYTAKTPLFRKRSTLTKPLAVRLDRFIFKRSTAIVVVSSYLKQHLIQDYQVPEGKILVVPNAADLDKFNFDTKRVSDINGVSLIGKQVIGFVGGFYPWHGLDLLLRAYAMAVEKFPNAILLLIGDGPESKNIKLLANKLGVASQVIFTGNITHQQLPSYVASFDVGIMPDSNEYGSPMKIFEYMAMKKPVIGPDYGPLLDVINHGEQGLIFERQNLTSLANCIKMILKNKSLAFYMGEKAYQSIVDNHTWQLNTENTLEFLKKIL